MGDAEVEHRGVLPLKAHLHHHVLGLEIAVHDPGAVGRPQGAGDLLGQPHHPPRRHRGLVLDEAVEISPGDQPHHHVGAVIVGDPEIVDIDDVGVADPRRRPGLSPQPLHGAVIPREPSVEQLDGHLPPQLSVLADVHIPHAAGPKPGLEHVGGARQRDGLLWGGLQPPRRPGLGRELWLGLTDDVWHGPRLGRGRLPLVGDPAAHRLGVAAPFFWLVVAHRGGR